MIVIRVTAVKLQTYIWAAYKAYLVVPQLLQRIGTRQKGKLI